MKALWLLQPIQKLLCNSFLRGWVNIILANFHYMLRKPFKHINYCFLLQYKWNNIWDNISMTLTVVR